MFPKSISARVTASVCFILILVLLAAVAWRQWGMDEEHAQTAIGGPFALTNTQGETVTAQELRGDHLLVFFGYTHCPDVCPMTLNAMSQALDVIAESEPSTAKAVTPVFITIDPERDDVGRMKEYLSSFHPRTVGLTGTPEQVAQAAQAYRISYSKVDPEEPEKTASGSSHAGDHNGSDHAAMDHGAYLMQHSSYVFLMGPRGQHLDHMSAAAGAPRIAAMIRENVKE